MHSLSPSGTTARRLRMVFRLLGWECESGDVSENGIWLAGMDSAPAPSQQTEYRSQTGHEGRALIPANGIPFSSAARRPGPHPSKRNTILKHMGRSFFRTLSALMTPSAALAAMELNRADRCACYEGVIACLTRNQFGKSFCQI